MNASMTRDELLALPPTVGIEIAARALGVGRTAAYALAKAGEFPCAVLQLSPGAPYKVLTADLHRLLQVSTEPNAPVDTGAPGHRIASGQLDRDLGALAADATRFAHLADQFTAGVGRKEPVSGAASQLAQMAIQLSVDAARIDGLRDAISYMAKPAAA